MFIFQIQMLNYSRICRSESYKTERYVGVPDAVDQPVVKMTLCKEEDRIMRRAIRN